ncbi:hypothetical protein AEMCBJ_33485 (plasmid) [Cupriavidus necator]|uniref:hypothetical protein n=1 Tax=Cupriavidus necator TaxID=106590 RepID=UPI003F7406C8
MSGAKAMPERIDGQVIEVWAAKDGKSWRAWALFRGREIEAGQFGFRCKVRLVAAS